MEGIGQPSASMATCYPTKSSLTTKFMLPLTFLLRKWMHQVRSHWAHDPQHLLPWHAAQDQHWLVGADILQHRQVADIGAWHLNRHRHLLELCGQRGSPPQQKASGAANPAHSHILVDGRAMEIVRQNGQLQQKRLDPGPEYCDCVTGDHPWLGDQQRVRQASQCVAQGNHEHPEKSWYQSGMLRGKFRL